MNVIEEIHRLLPNMHLVMHGSSSVPQDLQDIINQYGGKMPQTWGVPVEEIQRGIKHGVRKINIDTDNRMAMTGQIRKVLAEHPGEFDPRKYLKPAMEAMTQALPASGSRSSARRARPRRSSRSSRCPRWPSATRPASSTRASARRARPPSRPAGTLGSAAPFPDRAQALLSGELIRPRATARGFRNREDRP